MRGKRKNGIVLRLLVALSGLLSALLLAGLFYGTMVYQLGGEDSGASAKTQEDAPSGVLALGEGELLGEETREVSVGGTTCTVITRTYALEGDVGALAITATSAAYLERLALENWQPQLITGFVLAGLDAVYEQNGESSLLAARSGDRVYLLETEASEQTLYALGAGAWLE